MGLGGATRRVRCWHVQIFLMKKRKKGGRSAAAAVGDGDDDGDDEEAEQHGGTAEEAGDGDAAAPGGGGSAPTTAGARPEVECSGSGSAAVVGAAGTLAAVGNVGPVGPAGDEATNGGHAAGARTMADGDGYGACHTDGGQDSQRAPPAGMSGMQQGTASTEPDGRAACGDSHEAALPAGSDGVLLAHLAATVQGLSMAQIGAHQHDS